MFASEEIKGFRHVQNIVRSLHAIEGATRTNHGERCGRHLTEVIIAGTQVGNKNSSSSSFHTVGRLDEQRSEKARH